MPVRPSTVRLLLPALVALTSVPSVAQDMMDQAIDQSMMAMSLYAGSVPIEEDVKRSLRCEQVAPLHHSPKCPGSGSPRAANKARPAPGQAISLGYRSTPAIRKQALDRFVERVSARDARQGAAVRTQLGRHDYDAVYRGIVAPFGLRGDDAGDSMAAYMLLGWMIANGSGDPRPADVRGVRSQFAGALSAGRAMADSGRRALTGEEYKILFVVLHAGWQSARKEGKLQPYADGVARMIRTQTGLDLRAVRLAPGGFVPRLGAAR